MSENIFQNLTDSEKNEIEQRLSSAKKAHKEWVNKAWFLINGGAVSTDKIPKEPTDCPFGKWYYSEAKLIFGHLDEYIDIEPIHNELHDKYQNLFTILFPQPKKNWFQKMFNLEGSIAKPSESELISAKKLADELLNISDTVVEKIDALKEKLP